MAAIRTGPGGIPVNAMASVGLISLFTVVVGACGGGSTGPGGSTTPSAPAPTVTITVNPTRVMVGQSATVTWSSSNATACAASNAWSGDKPATGTASLTPTSGGQPVYALACTGAGGTASQSVTLVVPMPVFRSSYENAKKIVLSDPNIPSANFAGISNVAYFQGGSGGFGDFFQEGAYSAVVASANATAGSTVPDLPSTIFFLRKNASGNWSDGTSGILTDKTGCISPRKAIIADFNGDGKPDVFFACHGIDKTPFNGEPQRILLSQPNGTYSNTQLPFSGFTHGGSAADLNGDGRPDLVLTWTNAPNSVVYVLINNGDGTFTRDFSRLPTTLAEKAIYSAELIDTDGNGRYNLLLGGVPPDQSAPNPPPSTALANGLFKNDGTGHFLSTPYIAFPNPAGSTGKRYGLGLDFIFLNGFVYVSQVGEGYNSIAVSKVKLSDLSVTMVYEHVGPYNNGNCAYFTWIYPTTTGRILAQSTNVKVPLDPLSCFGVSFLQ